MSSNDLRTLTRSEILGILGTSTPNGNAQINAIQVDICTCHALNVLGDVQINGIIRTPLRLAYGIQFPSGTAANPSISFIANPTTGIYYTGTGVGFTAGGSEVMNVSPAGTSMSGPITTPGGLDLILNPSGSNIDCTNHNLINVAGISANANRYDVIAPATVVTTDTTPTILFNIPTVANSAYTLVADVTCTNSTTSTGAFTLIGKVKNIAGVLTISAPFASGTTIVDNPLLGITAVYGTSGTNATVVITGLAATTIKWFGAATITRQLF
jgi:hypothetical protein